MHVESKRRRAAMNLNKAVETTKHTKDTKGQGIARPRRFTRRVKFATA
jgi:hypothetical protein